MVAAPAMAGLSTQMVETLRSTDPDWEALNRMHAALRQRFAEVQTFIASQRGIGRA